MLDDFVIEPGAIDRLMPLHMRLDGDGIIRAAGPTVLKLRDASAILGRHVLDVFSVKHLKDPSPDQKLDMLAEGLLRVEFKTAPHTGFKASLVAIVGGGYLLNLSFGIGVLQAVSDYDLTVADFPETELTIEMLYLNEAQGAVLQESRQLIRRLQGAKIAAEEKAFTDTLTGLRNRRALDFALGRLIKVGEDFGLMHIDLDYFKRVNDTMGHAAGDYVLQHVARILVNETRGEDTVARVGGDEFVIVLKGLVDLVKMRLIGERIIEILERPIRFNGVELRIAGSIGATVSSFYAKPAPDVLMNDADAALYASKNAGRGRFTAFAPESKPSSDGAF